VAVNVRGTLEEPYISITSTPAMSSNEALLVPAHGPFDRHVAVRRGRERQPGRRKPRDERRGLRARRYRFTARARRVSVEKESDTGDTSVVLGKAISPKLFVSYGVSIAEAINTIKLRYTLNNRWAVKAESGLDQSADIEYKIER
jgi:translocation and assembly module TamB